ncbi:MAG: integrase arm-type DNA-binding domain-containing protein [Rhizomicrobium sp.]|jgi:integrase
MTTRKVLTDRGIQALKPAASGRRYVVYDTIVPPFGVRVSDKGHKTFIVYRRVAGQHRPARLTLGNYPSLSLDKARERAKAAVDDFQSGVHPREREKERQRAERKRNDDNFEAIAEEFIQRHAVKLRWGDAMSSTIRRELISRWGDKPITDINRRDVVEMLERIADGHKKGKIRSAGGRYAARHAFAYTSKLFNWALARDLYGLQTSPCDRIKIREIVGSAEPRQRVLTDEELRQVWRAAIELGYPFGTLTQLLLVTGQRLNEAARARWSEFDLAAKLWTLPPERMKGDAAHEVPLSSLALELIRAIPRFDGEYVLTTTFGERPISGFSKAKDRLDELIAEQRKTDARGKSVEPMPAWQFHDLRRTMRTHLSGLPIQELVRELVIAHRKPGLHKVFRPDSAVYASG